MEQLLHRGADVSDLGYLRILQLVHVQASLLVEDLKAHELPMTSSRTPYEAAEFRRSITGAAPATISTPAAISAMLETAMEELFVPYTEGQRYLEKESKSLTHLYQSLLGGFARYHVRLHIRFRGLSDGLFLNYIVESSTRKIVEHV